MRYNSSFTNSKYLNYHLGHIITADFWIIKNKKPRKIISKGPNYRETKIVNWKKNKENVM